MVATCPVLLFRKTAFFTPIFLLFQPRTPPAVILCQFCSSALHTLPHVKVWCWCVRQNWGGGSFSCLSNNPSIGTARSAGLRGNVQQDKMSLKKACFSPFLFAVSITKYMSMIFVSPLMHYSAGFNQVLNVKFSF